MKKLMILKKTTILIGILVLWSCQKNNEVTITKEFDIDYGISHNEAIIKYYGFIRANPQKEKSVQTDQEIALVQLVDYCITEGLMTNTDGDEFIAEFNNSGFEGWDGSINANDPYYFYENKIRLSVTNSTLKDHLLHIVYLTEQNTSISTIQAYITGNIANKNWGEDDERAKAFCEIYASSKILWAGLNEDPIPLLTENGEIILADAIGGLHGLIWGPFGSIIEGAFASLCVSEAYSGNSIIN
jgi:hypothetical protein